MRKTIIFMIIIILLMPGIAMAEEIPAEPAQPAEQQQEIIIEDEVPSAAGDEIPPALPEPTPEAEEPADTSNSIVVTDGQGNQYAITAETDPVPGEIDLSGVINAIIAQGVNINIDALKATLIELGLDQNSINATLQGIQNRPFLTTNFVDYTVTEGLLLVLCVVGIFSKLIKFIVR